MITCSVAVYEIVKYIDPDLEFSDFAFVGTGISFFVAVGIFFTRLSIFVDSKSKNEDRDWMIE